MFRPLLVRLAARVVRDVVARAAAVRSSWTLCSSADKRYAQKRAALPGLSRRRRKAFLTFLKSWLRDFVNRRSGALYLYPPVPNTSFYVLTHGATVEKPDVVRRAGNLLGLDQRTITAERV